MITTTTLLEHVTELRNREYRAVWFEGKIQNEVFTLNTKRKEDGADYEWKYALLENADEIARLKLNETMYFQAGRDEPNLKGFIVRIK